MIRRLILAAALAVGLCATSQAATLTIAGATAGDDITTITGASSPGAWLVASTGSGPPMSTMISGWGGMTTVGELANHIATSTGGTAAFGAGGLTITTPGDLLISYDRPYDNPPASNVALDGPLAGGAYLASGTYGINGGILDRAPTPFGSYTPGGSTGGGAGGVDLTPFVGSFAFEPGTGIALISIAILIAGVLLYWRGIRYVLRLVRGA